MYEIRANKNLCPPTLANYLTDWTLLCVYTVKEPFAAHPPPNKEATCRKNSSIASLFYSLLEDYIFLPHFGMTEWGGGAVGFFGGGPCELRQ